MTTRESERSIAAYRIINVGPEDTNPPSRPASGAKPVRKPTVIGMAPVAPRTEQDEKVRAIESLAAAVRAKKSFLAPRTKDVEQAVTAAVIAMRRKHQRTSVISIGQFRQTFNALPYAVREEALAGLRAGIANGVMLPLSQLLTNATGYGPPAAERAIVSSVKEAVEKAETWFSENLSDVAPKSVIDGFRATLGMHVMAIANGDASRIATVAHFTDMWLAGRIPVGVLTDNSFLVLVE